MHPTFRTSARGARILTACDGAGRGLGPSGPGPTFPRPTVTGEITITSISLEPGATVPVRPSRQGRRSSVPISPN
jgi:hypothetical protein